MLARCSWVGLACLLAGCESRPLQLTPSLVEPPATRPMDVAPVLRPRPATIGFMTLKALHMDCAETCPTSARLALQRVPSVYQVGVDLDHEALFISYDLSAGEPQTAAAPMLAALRAIGFDPWFKTEGWPAETMAADVPVLPL